MKKSYLSILIATTLSTQVFAQDVQELATTEVTTQEKSDFKVSAEDLIKTQVNDLKGTFRKVAGINVGNSTPNSQKVYLRGLEEHAANVTIDGARQDGQMFHHAGNQMIDTSMLKSVSVELGASSVLSGYGANVGAIKYETVDPQDVLAPQQKFGFKATAGMDTATEFQKLNLTAYGRLTEKLSTLASLNWTESGDIETPDSDPITNKHSELKSGLFKLVYDFSDVEQLDFSAQRYDDGGHRTLSGEKPGITTIDDALGFNGYVRDTYTLNYHNDSENPLLDLSVSAYFNEKKMVRGGSDGPYQPRGSDEPIGTRLTPDRDYIYKTVGLDIRNTFIVNDIAWTAGIESFKSEQEVNIHGLEVTTLNDGSITETDLSLPDTPEASLFAAYVQGEFKFGAITIVPGVRYDAYSLGGVYDNSFNQLSPKLNVNWQANEDLILKAGYGRIFKGPGLPETLTLSKDMQGSDDAKAETGNHFEFNIIQDLTSALDVDAANTYINLYHYTIDNSYHPTKNNTLTRNIFDLTMKGVEAGFRMSHQAIGLYINYSYNTGDNAYPTYTTDNFNSDTHAIKIGLDYQVSDSLLIGWDSNFSTRAQIDTSSIVDDQIAVTEFEKTGYGVSNIWLDYQPAEVQGLSVQLAVENVFDKAYQNHFSFGMNWGNADYNDNDVGRNFKLSASYQF